MIVSGVVRGRMRMAARTLLPVRTGGGRAQGLIGLVLVSAFATFAYVALLATFTPLRAGVLGRARETLALVFLAAVVGIAAFDLHYAVSALLLDSDLELLRRTPLSRAALFALKLVDSLPRTSALVVVLALPATLAFATAYPLPAWAWILLPFVLMGLWAVPLGAGVALALDLVRRLPPRVARDLVALLSTLVVMLLWLANSFVMPRLVAEGGSLRKRLPETTGGWLMLLPYHWAARAIEASYLRDPASAFAWATLLAATGALSLGWAAWAASRHLDQALARVAHGAAGSGLAPRVRPHRSGTRGLLSSVAMRDLKLFARDWTVLGDVIVAAALWTLLPLVGASVIPAPPRLLVRAMLLVLAAGLGYEVAARSVPLERTGLAWCQLAPVPHARWVTGKLAGAAVLSVSLLGLATATLALAFPLDPMEWLETVLGAASALGLSLSLGLWAGAVFGDPHWTNPRAMLTLAGRLVATLLLVVQAGGWVGLLGLSDVYHDQLPPGAVDWGPPLVAAMLSSLAITAAASRLRRLEWKW
ncbi:MAG: hypothetical protein E6K78_06310 [Candidatus Eisenbacteria bacterium]|uniref:Uncharacterized protein n=1 Tax=Eiseniibacteriota bacterium TaxID=2212470 RepID=A0A538TSE8_UNCEI|nr:MAG: hypothetical protein E6K78_06310 [Candidatus Eisenbacteria bacterium]